MEGLEETGCWTPKWTGICRKLRDFTDFLGMCISYLLLGNKQQPPLAARLSTLKRQKSFTLKLCCAGYFHVVMAVTFLIVSRNGSCGMGSAWDGCLVFLKAGVFNSLSLFAERLRSHTGFLEHQSLPYSPTRTETCSEAKYKRIF